MQVVWFGVSISFWALLAYAVSRFLGYAVFLSGGVLRIRVRIMQRLLMNRFNVFLAKKPMLMEERHYDERNTVVHYSWEEGRDAKGACASRKQPAHAAHPHPPHPTTTTTTHTHTHTLRAPKEYGYSVPKVTVEYDRATGYMLSVSIEYNRRMARRNQALTGAEVRNKVCENMIAAAIFEDANFTFKEDVVTVDASELRGEEHA